MAEKRSIHKNVRFRTGKTAKAPEAIPDGRVRCPGCGRAVKITKRGRIAFHWMPEGGECPQKMYGRAVHLDEIPPVVLPLAPAPPKRRLREVADEPRPRVVTGHCHECDRPVSGERRFCGPCLARRI